MIPCQRHLFDIPDDVAYLNCAYMGPLLNSARDIGLLGPARKSQPWTILPQDFFTDAEAGRALFAQIVNATADDIALTPSASYGTATAARNLPVAPGLRILLLEDQFPSHVYPWRELARARDAEVVTLPRPADDDWTAVILAALDERVAIAALPHVHWTDGQQIDLVAVGARCREAGAALVVDGTQSVGALPFDVQAIQPDFLAVATYKWLLGPYAAGYLYVAPKWHEGEPLEHNWIDRKGSDNFSGLVDYQDEFLAGARRYDVGERGNIHLVPMANAAVSQILDWGVAEIQETIRARTDRIADRAAGLGIGAVPSAARAGHYLGLRFPGGVPAGLADKLAAAKVYVSVRGHAAMRITPHLWVTDADEDRFFDVLAKGS